MLAASLQLAAKGWLFHFKLEIEKNPCVDIISVVHYIEKTLTNYSKESFVVVLWQLRHLDTKELRVTLEQKQS